MPILLGLGLVLTFGGQLPEPPSAPFQVVSENEAGVWGYTGFVGIGGIVALRPVAPFTLLDVRPVHVDPGLELVAVRAFFWGRGRTSSGYPRYPEAPGSVCVRRLTGYGPSYPVEGLWLRPGDPVRLGFYVRATRPGRLAMSGFRARYRALDGRVGTVIGVDAELLMEVRTPGQPGPHVGACDSVLAASWPGYPG